MCASGRTGSARSSLRIPKGHEPELMNSSYAIVLAVAVGTTLLVTPVVYKLATRFGAVVQPSNDPRRVHTRPMTTLGGAAMFIGFLVAIAVASQLKQFHSMFQSN